MRDIFICHAEEDKNEIVHPMVEAFSQTGISCWYDEAEIHWGDSISQKVNEGLARSRYVVMIFSPAFVQKNWPQRELNAVLNQEASTGDVKVLPLLVGSEQKKRQILYKFPLLNDKRYLPWDGELRNIVNALISRLHPEGIPSSEQRKAPVLSIRVPITKIKKKFTQRDKFLFLRNSFTVIKSYFQIELKEIRRHYQEFETDFEEIHTFKFMATIYVRGEIGNRCKIWIGGLSSIDSIAYYIGRFSIDSDNSFNDMLSIDENNQSLGFEPSGMRHGDRQEVGEQLLTAEDAAEYIWKRFTENLG